MDDIVRIDLGNSIVEGEMIAQTATSAGFSVRLLHNSHPETGGLVALGTCALLVRRDEEAEVREILADFGY